MLSLSHSIWDALEISAIMHKWDISQKKNYKLHSLIDNLKLKTSMQELGTLAHTQYFNPGVEEETAYYSNFES